MFFFGWCVLSDRKVSMYVRNLRDASDATGTFFLQEMFSYPTVEIGLSVDWITPRRKRKRNKTTEISVFTVFVPNLSVSAFSWELSTLIFFPDCRKMFPDAWNCFVCRVDNSQEKAKTKQNNGNQCFYCFCFQFDRFRFLLRVIHPYFLPKLPRNVSRCLKLFCMWSG